MKKYVQPSVEITAFEVEDIIMASGSGISLGKGASEEVLTEAATNLSSDYVVVTW